MGIFQDYIKVYNRAPITLTVTFDGQRENIPRGEGEIPRITVPFAKNQNPIMGSQDPNNPHMSGAQFLIVEEGDEGYGIPLTREEWEAHLKRPCRMNELALFEEVGEGDPKVHMVVKGQGRKTTAATRYEAGGGPGGDAQFAVER